MGKDYIDIFLSYAWSRSGHAETLKDWLFRGVHAPLRFNDTSLSMYWKYIMTDPDADIRAEIYHNIVASDVVVLPTGLVAEYGKMIQMEIDGALSFSRPIIAVAAADWPPASPAADAAQELVVWDERSIADAIVRQYRAFIA